MMPFTNPGSALRYLERMDWTLESDTWEQYLAHKVDPDERKWTLFDGKNTICLSTKDLITFANNLYAEGEPEPPLSEEEMVSLLSAEDEQMNRRDEIDEVPF